MREKSFVVIIGAGGKASLGKSLFQKIIESDARANIIVVTRNTEGIEASLEVDSRFTDSTDKRDVSASIGKIRTFTRINSGSTIIVVEKTISKKSSGFLIDVYAYLKVEEVTLLACTLGKAFWKENLSRRDYNIMNCDIPLSCIETSPMPLKVLFVGSMSQYFNMSGYENYTASKDTLLKETTRMAIKCDYKNYFFFAPTMNTDGLDKENKLKNPALKWREEFLNAPVDPDACAEKIYNRVFIDETCGGFTMDTAPGKGVGIERHYWILAVIFSCILPSINDT